MSESEIKLICNYKKCRAVLKTSAWATRCSHIFCDNHGSQLLNPLKKCPYCNKILTKPLDIIEINLNPDESFKSMILCGLSPQVIMDISVRAVTFWNYQMAHEKVIQATLTCTKQLQEKFKQNKMHYITDSKKYNEALKEAELQRWKTQEIRDKFVKQNKILQQVQGKYESLKRQLISYTIQSTNQLKNKKVLMGQFQPKESEDCKDEFSFAPIF